MTYQTSRGARAASSSWTICSVRRRSAGSSWQVVQAGWVTVPVSGLPAATLRDWVEESYRVVAPKRLVAELDARGGRRS